MDIHLILTILSGLCWTVVYLDGIRVGIRDQSYAIPFWALALNLAWELLYTKAGYDTYGMKPQTIINAIWLVFDIGILSTFFRYGEKYFPGHLDRSWFYFWSILGLLTSFFLQWTFFREFGIQNGAKYSAFLQNLLMSVLFIVMLVRRENDEGQSLVIAVSKWIGTLAATIHFGILDEGPRSFILTVGSMIAVFDIIYIVMLAKTKSVARSVRW
jgi:predicted neutral ceramidase superfamily lipid hydrolase